MLKGFLSGDPFVNFIKENIMNGLTTDWNNATYNSAHTFQDVATSVQVTVAAGNPVNCRAMYDSVASGAYTLVS